jgi:4-hydroxybenzoate polyprenyltransferase
MKHLRATAGSSAASAGRVSVVEWARRFVALSRLPHVLLDLATPAFAAILWLGRFPSARTMLLGLATAFAGYTAVYALNDLVDRQIDREKMSADDAARRGYLDAIAGRHPVARSLLSQAHGWAWVLFWQALAIAGAFLLRPACVIIFLAGGALEALYCRLYRVTPLRVLLSGLVKTLGGVAAVFVVDPNPDPARLIALVLLVFFWEMGGQNIPADWTDIDEDTGMRARTVPVILGARRATMVILACLAAAIFMSLLLLAVFRGPDVLIFMACAVLAGAGLLMYPSVRLLRTGERSSAQTLFNLASWYPLALLAIIATRVAVQV